MKKFAFTLLVMAFYSCHKEEEPPREPDPPQEWGVIDLNEYYKEKPN